MNLTLEDRLKADIGKYFRTKEFSFVAAFYYLGNFVEGMEKYLGGLSLDGEILKKGSLLNMFKMGVMDCVTGDHAALVSRAKVQGKIYMNSFVQDALNCTVEDLRDGRLILSTEQQELVMKQYKNLVHTLLHLLIDFYNVPPELIMAYHLKPINITSGISLN